MENKTGKYFKYAIGEIVLVVIGILIALSINNWNESVKNQVQEKSYLKSLIVDLSKDTLAIQNILAYQIEDSLKIATHQSDLTKNDASMNDLLRIMVYEWNPKIRTLRGFNTNTSEALVSTGNINLIDSEILNYLAILKSLQEAYITSIIPFIEFYRNVGDPTVPTPSIQSVINKGPIFDQMIDGVDKIALAYKFSTRLTLKRQTYRNSIRDLNEIKSKTEELLHLIKQRND